MIFIYILFYFHATARLSNKGRYWAWRLIAIHYKAEEEEEEGKRRRRRKSCFKNTSVLNVH